MTKPKVFLILSLFLILAIFMTTSNVLAIDVPASVKIVGERNTDIVKTITVKNNETNNMTNVTLELINVNNNLVNTIGLSTNELGNLTVGQSKSFDITVNMKKDLDSGIYKVAEIKVSWDYSIPQIPKNGSYELFQSKSKVIEVFIEPNNHLTIYRVTATVNNDYSKRLSDGSTLSVKPLDEVELEVEVSNTFNTNMYIDSIDISIDSYDLDVDDYDTISRLRDGERDSVTFRFTIPVDIYADSYPMTIEVTGYDENNARHNESIIIYFDVKKESHDLRILDLNVQPQPVNCGATLYVDTRIANLGTRTEREGVLEIRINSLNIQKKINLKTLYEGDTTTETLTLQIPQDTETGQYLVEARTYYNTYDLIDTEFATLTVECSQQSQPQQPQPPSQDAGNGGQQTSPSPSQGQEPVQIVPYQPVNQTSPSVVIIGREKKSGISLDFILGLIAGIVVAIIVALIILGLKKEQ